MGTLPPDAIERPPDLFGRGEVIGARHGGRKGFSGGPGRVAVGTGRSVHLVSEVVNMAIMETEAKVKGIIAEQLGVSEGEIKPGSSFIEDLGADSLDIVELVMAMEEEFEMEIPDDEAERIKTVQDAVSYISSSHKK